MPQVESLEHIIRGCRLQDRPSQKEFYKKFYGLAISICHRYLSNNEDAVEAVNDGFLKIFKSIQHFVYEQAFIEAMLTAWIKKIMVNTCIDRVRRAKVIYLSEVSDQNIVGSGFGDMEAVSKLSNEEVLRIVSKLTPAYKSVFNLYVIDGYTHEEISGLLGISTGTSKSNLSKAREAIKKMLAEAGINYYGQRVS